MIVLRSKLSIASSILLGISAVLIAVSLFLPWWEMQFFAPQYPEGLKIIVYPNKLAGQIDIVNGLNHYIGMSNFSEDNFPELRYLPYIIEGMAFVTLLAAIVRKKKLLYVLIGSFALGGILGVYDLHRWLHNFGTNLSPKAPIKVPPFVPPVLGHNKLANFNTYSILDTGSYLILAAFILLLIPLWRDRKK